MMDKAVNCVLVTTTANSTTTVAKNDQKRLNKWSLISILCGFITTSCLCVIVFLLYDRKNICLTEHCVKTAASLLTAMDLTADPCDDFFQFACGNWNKKHLIPDDRPSISTFEVLSDQVQVILKGLLEEEFNENDCEATKKAKDFYISCMNLTSIREIGDNPLKKIIDQLGGWPVTEGIRWRSKMSPELLVGKIRAEYNMGFLIELWIGPDDKNSNNNIIQIDQASLGLPTRDYYFNGSKELEAYHRYMVGLAIILGANPLYAKEELLRVIAFEKSIANISLEESDRQDTSSIYRKHTLGSLKREIPDFNWDEYLHTFLKDLQLDDNEEIVSYAFFYLKDMATIIRKTDKRTVQNYLIWRVLMELTSFLIDKYQETKIDFRSVLMGVTLERHRWHQCVDWSNKNIGMAVGALFIKDNFNQIAKGTAQEMIRNIRDSFIELLEVNPWMDEKTRRVARIKALKMKERIGYPDFLTKPLELNKEYDNLTISRTNFLDNIVNIASWKAQQNLNKLRKPVNKEKWSTEPAIVNAFFDPNKNVIVFPAGILQPLFYSQHFPKSLNFGGIGVVIGHEITHAFDERGRQFDYMGNMIEWWDNDTIISFREQTQCIIDQYNEYQLEGFFINGKMTQGENIADNGGLKQSYRAFKKWEREHNIEPLLPGLEHMTHDQYFFLNYAQIWCGSMRPEDLLSKIRSAVHSPAPIRVQGPLSNSIDFSNAYSCPLGSRMNPVKKCNVW